MNKKQQMWRNAFEKINEKYITESADFAPEVGGNENVLPDLRGTVKKSHGGNIFFILAAAAAVFGCIVGVNYFLDGSKEISVEPASTTTTKAEEISPEDRYEINNGVLTIKEGITELREGEFYRRNDIKAVELPDSLKVIGERAFEYCENLSEIEIPESVTEIGRGAFFDCKSLKHIRIPANVRKIDSIAFMNCEGLTDVKFEEGIVEIGSSAFEGCYGLTEIKLPDTVQTIGEMAFSSCKNLKSINIPEGVTTLEFLTLSACEQLEEVSLPESLREIENNAFASCKSLRTLKIPDNVTKLGENLFYGCISIKEISYKGKTYTLDNIDALYAAVNGGVTNETDSEPRQMTMDDVFALARIGENLTMEHFESFIAGGDEFETIYTIDDEYSVNISGAGMEKPGTISLVYFDGEAGNYYSLYNDEAKKHLTEKFGYDFSENTRPMTIEDTAALINTGRALSWDDFSAFSGRKIADGYGYGYIYDISDEYRVSVAGEPDVNPQYVSLIHDMGNVEQYYDFYSDELKNFLTERHGFIFNEQTEGEIRTDTDLIFDINNDVLTIGETENIPEYMFTDSRLFTKATIPAGVREIGSYAFAGSTLETVTIEGNTSIGEYAFADCASLKNVEFKGNITRIENYAFKNTPLTAVTIPDSVTDLGANAFAGCKNITIKWNGREYGEGQLYSLYTDFMDKKAASLTVGYTLKDGILTIPEGVTRIEPNAFRGNDKITEVVLPSTVTEICDYAFAESTVKKINIPDSVTTIWDYAFYMSPLEEIYLPDSVTKIEEGAFEKTNLTDIRLPSGLKTISNRMLYSVATLTSVEIPDSVEVIGDLSFSNTGLTSVTIPPSVKEIKSWAFQGCYMLNNVTLNDGLKKIGDNAFGSCTMLKTLTLPDSLIYAGAIAFDGIETVTFKNVPFSGQDPALYTFINYGISTDPAYNEISLGYPVDKPDKITTYFGYDEWRGGTHEGIDYGWEGCHGSNIYAAADGTVEAVQNNFEEAGTSSVGNYVIIDHGNGYKTVYNHCNAVYVKKGQTVGKGDVIASIGNTGNVTGPSLHFELLKDGVSIDPNPYFGREENTVVESE